MRNRVLEMWRDDLFKLTVRPFLLAGLVWFILQVARAVYRHDILNVSFSVVTFLAVGSVAIIWWIRNKD